MLDWERSWRGAGVVFAVLIIIASLVYGSAPKAGSGADQLVAFFNGDRGRILIAAVIFSFGCLALLWFGAALSSVLRDAGQGGWGAAAVPASGSVIAASSFRGVRRPGRCRTTPKSASLTLDDRSRYRACPPVTAPRQDS